MSASAFQTVVVVPCYNESRRLDSAAFCDFLAREPDIRFLFVNDGSTDATLSVLQRLAMAAPRHIEVLDLPKNQGKAEAVRQGLLAACQTDAPLIAYWDADLATPLDALPQFREVLLRRGDIDIVAGIRLPLLGRAIERKPIRRWLGRGFACCASTALKLSLCDTQCGAKMFRACPELIAAIAEPFLSRWIFDVELLVRWRLLLERSSGDRLASRTFELPLERWRDVPGSRLRPGDFLKAIRELAAIYARYSFGRGYSPPLNHAQPMPVSTRRRAA